MEKNNKIPDTVEALPKKENLEDLKTEIIEGNAREKLNKLWYWFIKKADWVYLLTKEWSYSRPNMDKYSETLYVEILNIDNLVKLAIFIEKELQKIKDDLHPYLDSDTLTKALYYRDKNAPKNIYNKETFLSSDILNPDSQIIWFSEMASLLWISPENQEENREYINSIAEKIMEFLIKIKINEKSK